MDIAILLPEGECVALTDLDGKAVWEELAHFGFRDQRIGQAALLHRIRIQKGKRKHCPR